MSISKSNIFLGWKRCCISSLFSPRCCWNSADFSIGGTQCPVCCVVIVRQLGALVNICCASCCCARCVHCYPCIINKCLYYSMCSFFSFHSTRVCTPEPHCLFAFCFCLCCRSCGFNVIHMRKWRYCRGENKTKAIVWKSFAITCYVICDLNDFATGNGVVQL